MLNNFSLIHVGKCGGSSVAMALNSRTIPYEHVHGRKPNPVSNPKKLVFLVRDPIERFISAFNWRYYLLSTNQRVAEADDYLGQLKLRAEFQFLSYFSDANDFALQIPDNISLAGSALIDLYYLIGHANRGFDFYYSDILNDFTTYNLVGILCTENLEADFYRLFGFNLNYKEKQNYPQRSRIISPAARRNLERLLFKEFEILEKIYSIAQENGVKMSSRYGWPR